MRRLSLRRRRPLAGRLADERGAVAVLVALLIVPLFGVGAIAVDVGSLYSDRAQLANAADAAALAIALDCARNNCGNTVGTATTALTANASNADTANATLRTPTVTKTTTSTGGKVTVTVSADQAHWFAPVLGFSSTRVATSATAAWATTTTGRANFPLAISWCEFQAQIARYPLSNTATHRINGLTQGGSPCTGPSGQSVPAGYLVTNPDTPGVCRTTSTLGSTVAFYPGMYSGGLPPSCSAGYLASLIGSDILFPVWDGVDSSGGIHVYSYAAFHIMGYDVYSSDPALYGWFTYAAQQSDATTNPTSTAPDLGARSVYLQG
jgi:Flp pilus assembly protein TadG